MATVTHGNRPAWTKCFEMEDIKLLEKAFQNRGNAMLIGCDLQRLQELDNLSSPINLILTWWDATEPIEGKCLPKTGRKIPSRCDPRITLWVSPAYKNIGTSFSIPVDKQSHYTLANCSSSMVYLYDEEPKLHTIKMVHTEDNLTNQFLLSFEVDKLRCPSLTTPVWCTLTSNENHLTSTMQGEFRKA